VEEEDAERKTNWVELPGYSRADIKVSVQELVAKSYLVDGRNDVCEGLIMHDPTAAHKLPSTFPNPLPHL
jgi:hypothetical protein